MAQETKRARPVGARKGVIPPCEDCGEPAYSWAARRCSDCAAAANRQKVADYKARNPRPCTDVEKSQMKAWRLANFPRYLCTAARGRAKKVGLPFDLVPEDIAIPATCPILGIPLVLSEEHARLDNLATLDRLVPALGYVKSNVSVISWRAKRLKSDATLSELELIVQWFRAKEG